MLSILNRSTQMLETLNGACKYFIKLMANYQRPHHVILIFKIVQEHLCHIFLSRKPRRIKKVELGNSEIKEIMSTVSYVTLNQMVFRLATAGKERFEDFFSIVL